MKIFENKFTIMEKSLNAYSTRATSLANNIANVNTPNYKRQDIQFENILSDALDEDNPKMEGKTSNNKHFKINYIPKIDEIKEVVITEDSTIMRNDGNNVDIEKEQAEFAKNNIKYQFATSRISQNFYLLKNAIKGK